jgi:hypothetical protein
MSSNMKNEVEYRVSMKCIDDNLDTANSEIQVQVFRKDVVNNIVEISLIQITTDSARKIGTVRKLTVGKKQPLIFFNWCDNLK